MIDIAGFNAGRKELKKRLAKSVKEIFVFVVIAYLVVIGFITADYFRTKHNYSILRDLDNYWHCCVIALILATLVYFRTPAWHRLKQTKTKLTQSASNYNEITSMLVEKKPFILYLSNFSSDINIEYHSALFDDFSAGYNTYGNEKGRQIINLINGFLPVIYLSNINDLTTEKKGLYLLCTKENWFKYFKILAINAKFIVLDYSEEFAATKSIKMELKFLDKDLRRNYFFLLLQRALKK